MVRWSLCSFAVDEENVKERGNLLFVVGIPSILTSGGVKWSPTPAAAAVANNILLTCEGIPAATERATAQHCKRKKRRRRGKPERPTSVS